MGKVGEMGLDEMGLGEMALTLSATSSGQRRSLLRVQYLRNWYVEQALFVHYLKPGSFFTLQPASMSFWSL